MQFSGRVTFRRPYAMALLLSLYVLFIACPGYSYNRATHMVTAIIAYSVLSRESPATLQRVMQVLEKHPCYGQWQGLCKSSDTKTQEALTLMWAARWPDDVKSGGKFANPHYDVSKWHFIDIPFTPGKATGEKPGGPNLLTGLEAQNKVFGSGNDEEKARAISWVMHLIGDAHCPLHAISLVNDTYPSGDRGGNEFWVRVTPSGKGIKLHALWDDLVLGSDDFRSVWAEGLRLKNRPEFNGKLVELEATEFSQWVCADNALGSEVAYANGSLGGGTTASQACVLPQGYTQKAKAVTERQVLLAGYRIARTLESLYKSGRL